MPSNRTLRALAARRGELAGLFGGVLLPLLTFGALGEEVWEREGFGWDAPLLLALHRHATPTLDAALIRVTDAGGPLPMACLAALVLAFLLARRRLGDATFVGLAVGGAATLNFLAKALFQRSRPALWPAALPETDYGFPSGHAMGSLAVIVTLIILLWSTRWRWSALLLGTPFVLAVGISRVYLGVHYPSDILAGWCAALVWIVGTHLLLIRPLTRWVVRRRSAWAT
ncbi:MAG: phosphatase PAP2 family protein [Thermomicrobiales bacterium]